MQRPALLTDRPAVGRQRLHDQLRRLPAARRSRRRPARPPPRVPRRDGAVRALLARVRAGELARRCCGARGLQGLAARCSRRRRWRSSPPRCPRAASGTRRSAHGPRSVASAPPRARCSAGCSPRPCRGRRSSRSTSRSGRLWSRSRPQADPGRRRGDVERRTPLRPRRRAAGDRRSARRSPSGSCAPKRSAGARPACSCRSPRRWRCSASFVYVEGRVRSPPLDAAVDLPLGPAADRERGRRAHVRRHCSRCSSSSRCTSSRCSARMRSRPGSRSCP